MTPIQKLAAALVLAGCVSLASARTYPEKIEAIPYPADEADWQKKCAWLGREIARQRDIGSYEATQPGTFSSETQTIVRNNVATLTSRMTDFHCGIGYVNSGQAPPARPTDRKR